MLAKAIKTENAHHGISFFQVYSPLQFLLAFGHSLVPSDSFVFVFFFNILSSIIIVIYGKVSLIVTTQSLLKEKRYSLLFISYNCLFIQLHRL